jgi:hypothetical protein
MAAIRGLHSNLAPNEQYTIVDLGNPPAAFTLQQPAAFNNSGQIIGSGNPTSGAYRTDCIVYTGKAFIDITVTSPDPTCSAQSISSADSKGVVRMTGSLTTPFDDAAVAFFGTLTVATAAVNLTKYPTNVPSNLYGVNLSGEAVGYSNYTPLGGFGTDAFVVAAGSTTLSLMQPQCSTSVQYCLQVHAPYQTCPFGGCSINDSGTIVGVDLYNGSAMTYVNGKPTSGTDLPIPTPSYYGLAINNANQIAFSYTNTSGYNTAAIYSITSGTTTLIPSFNGCSNPTPLSLSNKGQLFGFCQNSNAVFWTWDAVNGLQDINFEIPYNPAYAAVTPLGVNDSGQILVGLNPVSASGYHWGYLQPPAAPTHKSVRLAPRQKTVN